MPLRLIAASLLPQIQLAVLDERLPQLFQRWYPRFEPAGPARENHPAVSSIFRSIH
jgi:hypothetical protein